ncbi:MAG: hypothetical protein KAW41_00555 [Candidatus Diapherotrites archaeon]|nr:hypothetical protein [Candidatus Diapherotrites archaeon]
MIAFRELLKRHVSPILVVAFVCGLLLMAGPAKAITINISGLSASYSSGGTKTITVTVTFNEGDFVPWDKKVYWQVKNSNNVVVKSGSKSAYASSGTVMFGYGTGTYNDTDTSQTFTPASGAGWGYGNATEGVIKTFSVPITVPNTAGSYTLVIRLKKADGTTFKTKTQGFRVSAPSGGGSSDSTPAGVAPPAGYEDTFTPTTDTTEGFNDLIGTDEDIQSALEDAGIDLSDASEVQGIAELSAEVARHSTFSMEVSHTAGGGSALTVTVEYTGGEELEGHIIVIDIPKAFASSASSISVDAGGATVVVTQSDPVFTIIFDKTLPQSEKIIRFVTDNYVNRQTVKNALVAPTAFAKGYAEAPALLLPTPTPTATPAPAPTPTPTPAPTPVATLVPEAAGFDMGIVWVAVAVLLVVIMAAVLAKQPWKRKPHWKEVLDRPTPATPTPPATPVQPSGGTPVQPSGGTPVQPSGGNTQGYAPNQDTP